MITSGAAMVMLNDLTATLGVGVEESVNDTEKLNSPVAVGVPEIVPARLSNTRPGGTLPLVTAHVSGAVPPKEVKVAK